jgi:hypothetical protein
MNTTYTYNNVTLVGNIGIDSGQAMIGDPCYLEEWETNEGEDWNLEGKENHYSYQGASATTIKDTAGELGLGTAVVFSTGYGDGYYPVYVQYNEDGRAMMAIVDMTGEEPITAIDVTREYTIGENY